MAHFYGTLQGSRGEATRLGTKNSGVDTTAASWNGAVRTSLFHRDGRDCVRVALIKWQGKGVSHVIYEGPVDEYKPENA